MTASTQSAPIILVVSQAGMVAFFTDELTACGYHVIGETHGDAVFGHLTKNIQVILIFDHFIGGYHDITPLCIRLHAQSYGVIPIIVITFPSTRQRIRPVTTATYHHVGGVAEAIAHIRRLVPVQNNV